jgi:homoserine O-acetyltransferase/O-succinyltransferase
MSVKQFVHQTPFQLESGAILEELHISYHTYGEMNAAGTNVIWICHALTANADVADWWKGLVGDNALINPKDHFIVCANILGSCYGTTGPLSVNPSTNAPYYSSFPLITIRDMVQAHIVLRQYLGIHSIQLLMGGSMGGYQALEWAYIEPATI